MKLNHRLIPLVLSFVVVSSIISTPLHAEAKLSASEIAAAEALEAERISYYNKTIESNQITDWPQGPQVYADSAIVMEASTGAILYSKDIDKAQYPASITKIMTALLAVENCSMDETVTFSYNATHTIEAGSSSIYRTEGEELTVEETLYGLMLASANECANGLAEHIAGSIDEFAVLMNERAAGLGCTNTHFVNANGLHNENHYTSAHDMALITQAAVQNENFLRISGTSKYTLRATNKNSEVAYLTNHHNMIAAYKSSNFLDDTVIAGKTGYTSDALNTLVTVAERNGMTLICITMRTHSGGGEAGVPVFSDTALLLDYAADNFSKVNVANNETNFTIDNSNFFNTGSHIFGETDALVEINNTGNIILPNDVPFENASPTITFNNDSENSQVVATLSYTYQGQYVGSATIDLAEASLQEFTFTKESESDSDSEEADSAVSPTNFIKINVKVIFITAIIIAFLFVVFQLLRQLMRNFHFNFQYFKRRRQRNSARKRSKSISRLRNRNNNRRNRPVSNRNSNSTSSTRYRRTPKNRKNKYTDLNL